MTTFTGQHKRYSEAQAAMDTAPIGKNDAAITRRYEQAYSAVIRAPIVSMADTIAARRFCREHVGDAAVPKILDRVRAYQASGRQAA
jgi:hypothetical protein